MGNGEMPDGSCDGEFAQKFAQGKEPIIFDPDVSVDLQNPVLVEMMGRGPQVGEIIWTGCTGAYVERYTDEGLMVMHGRLDEPPLDPKNYVPAFG